MFKRVFCLMLTVIICLSAFILPASADYDDFDFGSIDNSYDPYSLYTEIEDSTCENMFTPDSYNFFIVQTGKRSLTARDYSCAYITLAAPKSVKDIYFYRDESTGILYYYLDNGVQYYINSYGLISQHINDPKPEQDYTRLRYFSQSYFERGSKTGGGYENKNRVTELFGSNSSSPYPVIVRNDFNLKNPDGSNLGGSDFSYSLVTEDNINCSFVVETGLSGSYKASFSVYCGDVSSVAGSHSPVHSDNDSYANIAQNGDYILAYYNSQAYQDGLSFEAYLVSDEFKNRYSVDVVYNRPDGNLKIGNAVSYAFTNTFPATHEFNLHDFYSEYSYRLKDYDSITVWIEVTSNGSSSVLDTHAFNLLLSEDGELLGVADSDEPFSKKKDYIPMPSLDDYFNDFPDFPELEEFPDMPTWDSEHPLDSIWNLIKWVGQCIITPFKNLWLILKWLVSTLIYCITETARYLRDCLWTIIQNIGIALYNLVCDLKSIFKFLFVPNSAILSSYVSAYKDKLGNKFSFYEEIVTFFRQFVSNLTENTSAPEWRFTWKDQELLAVDFSGVSGVIGTVKDIILAISWIVFLRYIFKSLPSIIGSVPSDQTFAVVHSNYS